MLEPSSLLVLLLVTAMLTVSLVWWIAARIRRDGLLGALSVVRELAPALPATHPLRRRSEVSPSSEIALEEIVRVLRDHRIASAARGLLRLSDRLVWIERFAQFSVHVGILGTVYALLTADATELAGLRTSLPAALGTTFWGLLGALGLSTVAGLSESLILRTSREVRDAFFEGLDRESDVT